MLKKLLCLFAIVVLYPDGADAQKTYTLDDAVKTAIANDPVIKNFKNNLEIQKLNISTSKGSLLPTLSLTGNYTRSHVFTESGVTIIQGVPITRPRQDITRNNFNFSLNSDVVLFDGFANTRKIDLAEEQVDVLKFNLENAKNNIVLSVNQKFFQVLKSEQIVKQNEENLADSKAQLDKIKEIVNVGRGTIGDVYRQDVQVAQNELALERAKNDLRKSKVDLQAAMYDEIGKDINVAQGDIKSDYETAELEMILRGIGTLDELSDIALKNRYDYKAGLERN